MIIFKVHTSINLEHDVKPEHIVDYLDDILFILNTEEESNATVNFMAN